MKYRIYKLEWEMVSAVAYPEYYIGSKPLYLPETIPNRVWGKHTVKGDIEKLTQQYDGLIELQEANEYIRNVRLYTATAPVSQFKSLFGIKWNKILTGGKKK